MSEVSEFKTSNVDTGSKVENMDKTQDSEIVVEKNSKADQNTNLENEGQDFPTDQDQNCNQDKNNVQLVKESNPSLNKSSEVSQCDPKNVHYEGDVAVYTDPNSGTEYQWDNEKNEWVTRNNVAYGFEDDTHVYTDSEGTKYFWDKEKNAWFPKVDEEFMAHYQMSYGFVDNTKTETQKLVEKPHGSEHISKKQKGEKRKASEPSWFEVEESKNSSVYVSNLPTDIEELEFIELMQKCGLVLKDPQTSQFKIKLYKEPGTDFLKGDALCTYIRTESVDLALNVLDGYYFKNKKIRVEKAKFQLKGEFDPKLKPKMKKKKEKLKLRRQQEKLLDWRPEKQLGERAKHEKVVIVRNLFDPAIFDTDVGLILEFQQDLREECSKHGTVNKVLLYDRHPEGVAQINMGSPEEADQVVEVLNGRWFMKRQLTAEIWDGKTKFKIAETDSEISQRLNNWDKYLEDEEGSTKKDSNSKDISMKTKADENSANEKDSVGVSKD